MDIVHIFVTDKQTIRFKYMKTDVNNGKSSIESNYKRIEFFISQANVIADEDEARLSYEKNNYILTGWLSGTDFEYEFYVDGESEELEDPEQELIFQALQKEIDNERTYAFYDSMDDTESFINANLHTIY